MKWRILRAAVLLMAVITTPSDAQSQQAAPLASRVFSIREHGAQGDGQTLDTAAINRAIEACAAAGGGQVLVPPGRYLTGTVHLRSHVTVVLEPGATLVGSTNLDHYQHYTPPVEKEPRPFLRWHRALILGEGVEDVVITGEGTIDGNRVFDAQGEERMRGPHTILLGNSRNVSIRGVSIRDSANYAILMKYCEKIDVRNRTFTGGWDGVHFRRGRDVTITGCRFFTGDDSIAGSYWENVLIADCIVNSSCNGVRLIGPAEHLIIHDCLFYGPGIHEHRSSDRHNMLAGIILQPGAWDPTEGRLYDDLLSDLTMRNVTTPLHVALQPG
ncbi:MAG: right-handed parallel beta-helix repeat-containing protein, partial [Thermoguttaceae bacterium]|nr:right-handed parallel beta-helix repeat-containing protein [Thermoguttaceae bacterium]